MKRTASIFICLVLTFLLFAIPSQASEGLDKIDAPYMVEYTVRDDGKSERVVIACALTDEFASLTGDRATMVKHGISSAYSYIQLDYRVDGGEWQYSKEWDNNPEASFYGSALNVGETVKTLDLLYLNNDTAVKNAGALAVKTEDGKNAFDFENHSLEFRLRAVLAGAVEAGNFIMLSDWTEPVAVKRDATSPEIPREFETPEISDVRVEYVEGTDMPYISFKAAVPESIKQAQIIYTTHGNSGMILRAYVDLGGGFEQATISSTGGYFSNEEKKIYFNATDFDDEKLVKVKFCYFCYDEKDNPLTSEETEHFKVITPRWVEGKGLLPAKCTTCGICTPIGGKLCMFIFFGIAAAVIIVAAIVAKMQIDKARVRKAEAEEERQRKLEAERAAYNAKKQQNKQKNKKG